MRHIQDFEKLKTMRAGQDDEFRQLTERRAKGDLSFDQYMKILMTMDDQRNAFDDERMSHVSGEVRKMLDARQSPEAIDKFLAEAGVTEKDVRIFNKQNAALRSRYGFE